MSLFLFIFHISSTKISDIFVKRNDKKKYFRNFVLLIFFSRSLQKNIGYFFKAKRQNK